MDADPSQNADFPPVIWSQFGFGFLFILITLMINFGLDLDIKKTYHFFKYLLGKLYAGNVETAGGKGGKRG